MWYQLIFLGFYAFLRIFRGFLYLKDWLFWESKSFSKLKNYRWLKVTLCLELNWYFYDPSRVSTGIPGYGLRTEMIRKFFPFPLWKRFRKTGIPERFPERFFPRKTEISGTLFRNYGSLRNSGTYRNIVPEISGFRNIWYQNYIKVLHK